MLKLIMILVIVTIHSSNSYAYEPVFIDKTNKFATGNVGSNSVESIGCRLSASDEDVTLMCYAKDSKKNKVMCILQSYKFLKLHFIALSIKKGDYIRFEWNKYKECTFLSIN